MSLTIHTCEKACEKDKASKQISIGALLRIAMCCVVVLAFFGVHKSIVAGEEPEVEIYRGEEKYQIPPLPLPNMPLSREDLQEMFDDLAGQIKDACASSENTVQEFNRLARNVFKALSDLSADAYLAKSRAILKQINGLYRGILLCLQNTFVNQLSNLIQKNNDQDYDALLKFINDAAFGWSRNVNAPARGYVIALQTAEKLKMSTFNFNWEREKREGLARTMNAEIIAAVKNYNQALEEKGKGKYKLPLVPAVSGAGVGAEAPVVSEARKDIWYMDPKAEQKFKSTYADQQLLNAFNRAKRTLQLSNWAIKHINIFPIPTSDLNEEFAATVLSRDYGQAATDIKRMEDAGVKGPALETLKQQSAIIAREARNIEPTWRFGEEAGEERKRTEEEEEAGEEERKRQATTTQRTSELTPPATLGFTEEPSWEEYGRISRLGQPVLTGQPITTPQPQPQLTSSTSSAQPAPESLKPISGGGVGAELQMPNFETLRRPLTKGENGTFITIQQYIAAKLERPEPMKIEIRTLFNNLAALIAKMRRFEEENVIIHANIYGELEKEIPAFQAKLQTECMGQMTEGCEILWDLFEAAEARYKLIVVELIGRESLDQALERYQAKGRSLESAIKTKPITAEEVQALRDQLAEVAKVVNEYELMKRQGQELDAYKYMESGMYPAFATFKSMAEKLKPRQGAKRAVRQLRIDFEKLCDKIQWTDKQQYNKEYGPEKGDAFVEMTLASFAG